MRNAEYGSRRIKKRYKDANKRGINQVTKHCSLGDNSHVHSPNTHCVTRHLQGRYLAGPPRTLIGWIATLPWSLLDIESSARWRNKGVWRAKHQKLLVFHKAFLKNCISFSWDILKISDNLPSDVCLRGSHSMNRIQSLNMRWYQFACTENKNRRFVWLQSLSVIFSEAKDKEEN